MLTFPSHAAGAYLAIKVVDSLAPDLGLGQTDLLVTGVVAGVISDIDGLFYIGNLRDHHDTPLHTPSFWLAVFFVMLGVNSLFSLTLLPFIASAFLGVSTHLFLDWYAGRVAGLRIFYPFSKKRYSLFPLERDKGVFSFKNLQSTKEYMKFYASNKILLISEILIAILCLALII